jgi:hypothetical protein
VQPLAAQIEEAVLQPNVFRIFLLTEDGHRQLSGRTKDLNFVDVDFDGARRQFRILGAGGTPAHLAVDPHHPFRAEHFSRLESGRIGIGHHLRDAVMVTQIDE